MTDTTSLEQVRSWLNVRCGISYSDKKRDLLLHRLGRVVQKFQCDGLEHLAERLKSDHDLQQAVLHAASTNHTFFFREPQVLDFFRNVILPSAASRGTPLHIWSAAASSGDEAYTLAIIAAEQFGRRCLRNRLAILGTDLSMPVVHRAELGLYGQTHIDNVPPAILHRYFSANGNEQYKVADDIRRVCTFRRMNLKATPYPFRKPFQVVFCRNVLYYFDRHHQQATLEAIYEATEPGGWLVTSATETIRDLGTRWTAVASGIYRKAA